MTTKPVRYTGAAYDREWEEFLERIVAYTTRSAIIAELVGADSADRVSYALDRVLRKMNQPASRGRGNPVSFESTNFMNSQQERLEGALLLSLHPMGLDRSGSGRHPSEGHLHVELHDELKSTAWLFLQVYERYLATIGLGQTPKISFDLYYKMMQGISAGAVPILTCSCCGARSPYNLLKPNAPACPLCVRFDLGAQIPEFRRKLSDERAKKESPAAPPTPIPGAVGQVRTLRAAC